MKIGPCAVPDKAW